MRPNQGNRPIQKDQKIVRFGNKACSSGYCDELGLLLRETTMSYVYRMRVILKEFGADLTHAVRVDQFYTQGPAVSAYHLSRFAERINVGIPLDEFLA